MNILSSVLLVVLGILAVWLMRVSKSGVAWAKVGAALCSLLVIALAVGRIVGSNSGSTATKMVEVHQKYQAICGSVLGASLVERHPDARVLILTAPFTPVQQSQPLLSSLQEALEDGGLAVTVQPMAVPEGFGERFSAPGQEGVAPMSAEEEEQMMMYDSLITFGPEQLVEALNDAKGKVDVVVCMVESTGMWDVTSLPAKGSAPALVLINNNLPDPESLLETSVLDTFLTYRQNPEAWKPGFAIPENTQEAFDLRYELLTAGDI